MEKHMVSVDTLRAWKDNPRSISPKDFARLKLQIQKLGQYKPLLITPDGEVIGGNMRLKAYNDLGIKDVWVSIVEPKDENEKLEYALSDNDRAGYYDDDMLANLIPNYDIDWSQYAVDMKPPEDIQKLIDRIAPVEEDEAPEVAEGEAVSKLGEVYQLGRHRLMCGDSTKIEEVEKLMDGQKADMVFTDPPYGVGYDGGAKKRDKLIADEVGTEIYANALPHTNVFSKNEASLYLWYADAHVAAAAAAAAAAGWTITAQIIWVKNNAQFVSSAHYHGKHEPCFYAHKKGKTCSWYGGNTQVTVWNVDRSNVNEFHPTQKPVQLGVNAIKNSSKDGDIVMDLFGGSGSTLIACEETNRICYMMELDPKYCDVIRKRYAKFIGKEEKWQTITQVV